MIGASVVPHPVPTAVGTTPLKEGTLDLIVDCQLVPLLLGGEGPGVPPRSGGGVCNDGTPDHFAPTELVSFLCTAVLPTFGPATKMVNDSLRVNRPGPRIYDSQNRR
jgi:hypothetical protein